MAMEQMHPEEYLELNNNGNSRRNQDVALRSYEGVMNELGQAMGEEIEALETATTVKLPFLLMKYFQAAKREDDSV